ncbi:hypothetical protein RIL73_00005 (plasmid) [Enterobacter asburiae]|uniref:hypothetical protein n=1 Tax=Enterobacter asburiae TaxID=61645 RepID=UPI00288BF602|nr:hypothetical protein [Enterobacter asburiae]WNI61152.1 hypothetical protein RIL73_00005 [Enterobacter asburiae]
MKRLLLLLAALGAVSLSLPAFADSINYDTITGAATRNSDLSRQLLIMVFGDVVNNPLQPQNVSFIGLLYGVFNAIIAGLAFIWFMAITLRATVLTGNRGRVFGQGNTMMAPVTGWLHGPGTNAFRMVHIQSGILVDGLDYGCWQRQPPYRQGC